MPDISFISMAKAAPAATDTPEHKKLEKAAREFEGLLMSALWKSLGEDMKGPVDSDAINANFTDMGMRLPPGPQGPKKGQKK